MTHHHLTEDPIDSAERRDPDPAPTYHSYLHLDDLLTLQRPRSEHRDELHFIVAHQSIELWFQLLLHDLRHAISFIDQDRWYQATAAMTRVSRTVALVIEATHGLRDLPAGGFHQFRGYLGSASGAQSTQYRQIEILSGLRDESHLATQRKFSGGCVPSVVVDALRERSLADAHQAAGRRHGLTEWADLWDRDIADSPLYGLSEQLLEYDELWVRWRTEHIALVERMSGLSSTGTAGTDPMTFLGQTLRYRFFPYLWTARATLATRGTKGELAHRTRRNSRRRS
ncbi:tryptophan 2,3-dioxygenase family protein [Streptomyces inhibens]|uniref:tryptophan 2,3-dioxygenase family protein n=1 Tax=Streptomyces inhibens TaxID=2293571 RepID=UPI001EE69C9A|nr:tryptophan 2,3-dioxygenase family protein [Streptomyces inhibens]UKY51765.1 hypothetical protein KI385_25130 [Streptomyces inhibens]